MGRKVFLLPCYTNGWNFSTLALYMQHVKNLGFLQGSWFLLSALHKLKTLCPVPAWVVKPNPPAYHNWKPPYPPVRGYNFHHRHTGGNMISIYVIFICIRNQASLTFYTNTDTGMFSQLYARWSQLVHQMSQRKRGTSRCGGIDTLLSSIALCDISIHILQDVIKFSFIRP